MGAKSTRTLTRADALELYFDMMTDYFSVPALSDKELESMLDQLEEWICKRDGRPCFTNYVIGRET